MTDANVTCRVLLVEDIETEAQLVTKHLRRVSGWRFIIEHHDRLTPGLERARDENFDVVLLDLNLPDGAGLEVCQRMRKAAPQTPIIVLTNQTSVELGTKALREGAQDYLIKREVDGPLLGRAIRYAIERTRVDRALRESEQRYALAVAGANDGIWDWRIREDDVYFSPRWKSILGYTEGEIADQVREWFERVDHRDRERFDEALNQHLEGRAAYFECEYRMITKGGETRWVSSRGIAVRDDLGTPLRMAGSMTDITRRKQTEARLLHEAMHDALTGLPNRILFTDRLDLALRRFRRDPTKLFAVLFFDLDRFKHVNDSLGHAVGDELLAQVAGRILGCLRPGDTLARLGGDEFVVLSGTAQPDDASRLALKLLNALSEPFDLGGEQIRISASIGIAVFPDHGVDRNVLMRAADIAMYSAKAQGRGRFRFFSEDMSERTQERMQMEQGLRRAIDADALEVHYQPQLRLCDRHIVGVEALVRWPHPEWGMVSPSRFVPVAEESGIIETMGLWVLRRACRDIVGLANSEGGQMRLAVNVSVRQFLNDDFVAQVLGVMAETGFPAESLELEITESTLQVIERSAGVLDALKRLGVSIGIDDFGTGYSSLSVLRDLPIDRIKIDRIKIDRSFIVDLTDSDDARSMINAMLTLGRSLRMSTIAEGIELDAQARLLGELGCSEGQGFLFARPLPLDALRRLIARRA